LFINLKNNNFAGFKFNTLDKNLREYEIEYSGLKIGTHSWNFKVEDEFFDNFEYSEIHHAHLNVDVIMDKQERLMIFDFNISGFVSLPCDRCLDNMNVDINGSKRLIFKLGKYYSEETDEIIIIPEQNNIIDLSGFIYEFITIMIPIRNVHPNDLNGNSKCNSEILEKLKKHTSKPQLDPRWNKLKDLLN
jgi:uncharacterized metal-binding protein YceD (DUF177 family)